MPEERQEKSDTLRKFSHDLRNELGAIANYAQALELSLAKKDMDKERDIAREIIRCVEAMESLVAKEIDALNS